jgi:PilZ domain
MSTAMKLDLWDAWERSVAATGPETGNPARQNTSEFLKEPAPAGEKKGSATMGKEGLGDLRHSRRRPIRSNAEIVDWHSVQVKPDIAQVVDASSDGILFATEREYTLGMDLLVRFPYPCASSPKQRGRVVRVEEQPDGHHQVAVRFG